MKTTSPMRSRWRHQLGHCNGLFIIRMFCKTKPIVVLTKISYRMIHVLLIDFLQHNTNTSRINWHYVENHQPSIPWSYIFTRNPQYGLRIHAGVLKSSIAEQIKKKTAPVLIDKARTGQTTQEAQIEKFSSSKGGGEKISIGARLIVKLRMVVNPKWQQLGDVSK